MGNTAGNNDVASVRCPRCGKFWPRTAKICRDDGTQLHAEAIAHSGGAPSQPSWDTAIDVPFAGSFTDAIGQPSSAISKPSWDTAVDVPFAGSHTDLVHIDPREAGAAASARPTNPIKRQLMQTVGSYVPASNPMSRRAVTPDPFSGALMPGARVGDYEIEGKIGEGAMGAVYRAVHPTIRKYVAVKIMNPRLYGDEGAVERFTREARTVAAIRHPGIVDVFGFGTLDGGRVYLIMEWIDGRSLAAQLANGRVAVEDALDILDQIARALEAAHDKGVIHRDLKPDNVFLQQVPREKPLVKILDFGLAKSSDEQGRIAKTQTGQLLGTPLYMSPEQGKSKGVDHRTDIYALGCIAYELLCGRVPFDADNIAELLAAHLMEPPPLPRSLWPEISPPLDGLLFAMLAKEPAQRPTLRQVRQTISDVRSASAPGQWLTPAPGKWPTPVPPPGRGDATPHPISLTPIQPTEPSATALDRRLAPRRPRIVSIAIAGAAVFVAALVVYTMVERRSHEQAAESKTASVGGAPVPVPDDRPDRAKEHIRKVLGAFVQWSPRHAGAPCPNTNDLAIVLGGAHEIEDPWGNPIALTCADQPADQMIGVISAGPDGAFATTDDVASWKLGLDITSIVHGTHWTSAATSPVAPRLPTAPSPTLHRTASQAPKKHTARTSTTKDHTAAATARSASVPSAARAPAGRADPIPTVSAPPPPAQDSNAGIPRTR